MRKFIISKGCVSLILIGFFLFLDQTVCAQGARSAGTRDPFVPLLGMDKDRRRVGLESVFTIEDVSIEGIASGPQGKKALILNGDLILEGQTIGLVTVKEVGSNSAKIIVDGYPHTIKLYE